MSADKLRKQKTPMRKQQPAERVGNFEEVALGYTTEEAVTEAQRCLGCKKPSCMNGCPVEVDIPGFIKKIQEGDFLEAARIIKSTNPVPAVCGRVCPQEDQCEKLCVLARRGEPVAIGRLERFVSDYEAAHAGEQTSGTAKPMSSGAKVAVIGSGPAGLVCASELARKDYAVTIFESLHEPGGVLVYGIPEFRLPKAIVRREVEFIKSLGVEIQTNYFVGRTRTIDQLMKEDGFDAVFVGTGAGLPSFMRIPGENLLGIYSANEFLTRMNLMKAFRFPQCDTPVKVGRRVGVIGGGNVAMDSARVALRAGADDVTIFYRRTRNELPARIEEVENAEEEGIRFEFLVSPVAYHGDERGWLTEMELLRMSLGEPDASGRRRPVPVKGSEYCVPIDTVVVAIGQNPSPLVGNTTPGLEAHPRWGTLLTSTETGATTKQGVFAGGDIATGAATVILAAGAGKVAARSINFYLEHRDEPGIWEKLTKDI